MSRSELSAEITRLMFKCLWNGWKWYRVVKAIASSFPCYPVNRECWWKKTQIERRSWKILEKPNYSVFLYEKCNGESKIWKPTLFKVKDVKGNCHYFPAYLNFFVAVWLFYYFFNISKLISFIVWVTLESFSLFLSELLFKILIFMRENKTTISI